MNRNRPAGLVSIRTNIGCSASVSPHPELGSAPDAGEKGVVMNACPPAPKSQSLIRWTVLAVCCLILGSRQGDRAAAQEPLLLPSPPAQSQPEAEVVTRDATPTFSSRVNLVPVSVVVRDDTSVVVQKENPELEAPAAPAHPEPVLATRFFAYLFDDVHLKFEDLAY